MKELNKFCMQYQGANTRNCYAAVIASLLSYYFKDRYESIRHELFTVQMIVDYAPVIGALNDAELYLRKLGLTVNCYKTESSDCVWRDEKVRRSIRWQEIEKQIGLSQPVVLTTGRLLDRLHSTAIVGVDSPDAVITKNPSRNDNSPRRLRWEFIETSYSSIGGILQPMVLSLDGVRVRKVMFVTKPDRNLLWNIYDCISTMRDIQTPSAAAEPARVKLALKGRSHQRENYRLPGR